MEEEKVKEESIFPVEIDLKDIREAVHGRTDFREVAGPDFVIFIYFLGMAKDIFPDPATAPDPRTAYLWKLRRECRGIAFNPETGKVIARRFHKFFNVNEIEETQSHKIDLSKPYVVLEKLDGSMISPFYTEGRLRFATKQGVTDTSRFVEEFVEAMKDKAQYQEFSEEWVNKGWTPIYEWCSRKTRIVLDYPDDTLTLITLRHIRTGNYFSYQEMIVEAAKYNIPCVKARTKEELGVGESSNDFMEFQQAVREKNIGLEGFVLRFDSGLMLKIKTRWYCEINKSLDLVSRSRSKRGGEIAVVKMILDEQFDDLKGWLDEGERRILEKFEEDLLREIDESAKKLFQKVWDWKVKQEVDKKEFAKLMAAHPSAVERVVMFQIWKILEDNADTEDVGAVRSYLIEFLKSKCGGKKHFDPVRCLIGNLKYDDYFIGFVPEKRENPD